MQFYTILLEMMQIVKECEITHTGSIKGKRERFWFKLLHELTVICTVGLESSHKDVSRVPRKRHKTTFFFKHLL